MKASGAPYHSNEETLNCWKEHFLQALNFLPAAHFPDLEEEAPKAGDDVSVCVIPPSLSEVHHAVRKLKNG